METYRYQAGSYARILERTLGKPVADVYFVFLQGGENAVETIRSDDLELAKAEVREFLREQPS